MLKWNAIANFIGQSWSAVVALLFVPVYIDYLGVEAYGLIGIFALLQAWLRMMADTLGIAIEVPAAGELGGALGAARLALLAVEGGDPHAVCAPPGIAKVIEPRGEAVERQAARHARYRALYPALAG